MITEIKTDNSVPDGIAGVSILPGSALHPGVLPDWGVIEEYEAE